MNDLPQDRASHGDPVPGDRPAGTGRPASSPTHGPENLALRTYRSARRLVILVVGSTVLLAGVAMILLPGPAMVMIPLGLAILGIEFAWARRKLRRVRELAEGVLAERDRSGRAGNG